MTWRLFARPSQSLSLSRFLPSIFSSTSSTAHTTKFHSQNISALALGAETPTGGREVWALVDTRVQRWDMKSEGWEDLSLDADVSVIIASAIRESFGTTVDQDDKQVDLELVDLAVDG
jgi:nuclear pore complex protein Nup133